MDLKEIREKIDITDREIFEKISHRLSLVEDVVKWKEKNGMKIFDPTREEIIIAEKREIAEKMGFSPDTAEEILRSIIAESHLQEKKFLQSDKSSPRKIRRKKILSHPPLVEIFERIAQNEEYFCFLESLGDDEWSQKSLLSLRPKTRFAAKGSEIFIDDVSQGQHENPISWLEEEFTPYQNLVQNSREEGFCGGLLGHINFEAFGYEEKNCIHRSHSDFYDFEFGLFTDCLVYDRKTQDLEYVFSEEDRSHEIEKLLSGCFEKNNQGFSAKYEGSNMSDEDLEGIIDQCKIEIENGNVFQIVPSRKFFYDFSGSYTDFYKQLRVTNPSPNMFFLNFSERKLIASSPEMISKVVGKRIETYPIAGTRSRGDSPKEDAFLSAKMLSDEKEIAEHLMLVDMARNDLGKVCEYGSVKVEETMALKKYNFVQHLVSRVAGTLRKEVSPLKAMLANFPMGTVSGSPRIEAVKILQRLESHARGPYSGGAGFWSFTGDMTMTLAIRGLFAKGQKCFSQAGAGIVYDSVPEFERKEIEKKSMNIRSLLEEK